jgi:hypothetical protein
MRDGIPDLYVGGYAGIKAEFERRNLKAPSRQSLHRMIATKQFPAGTPLGGDPTSPRCRKDWLRSTLNRWFEEREALAA